MTYQLFVGLSNRNERRLREIRVLLFTKKTVERDELFTSVEIDKKTIPY